MSEPTVNKPTVGESVATGSYFYFTRYRPTANGKGMEVVGKKTDVTDSVSHIVEQNIGRFLQYLKETYKLELLDPEAKTEEDGQSYLYGVREKTGYETINELVAEWRES